MNRLSISSSLALISLLAPALRAESKNPADYPLRIHVFRRNATTFYHNRIAEEAKGEGRANLYENSEPRGLDFEFDCSEKLQTSSGYETFLARWKKPQQELVVLMPQFGKPDHYSVCKFKVEMKDFAYYTHDGNLSTEPIAVFKQWMTRHEYDPEHGKDTPTPNTQAPSPTPAQPAKPTALNW